MNIEAYSAHCLQKPAVTETFPFGDDVLVYKVAGKMFTLAPLAHFDRFSVKCDPEVAIALRATYDSVVPGYHLNKKHWNTVYVDGSISDTLLLQWITDSYQLVVAKLPHAERLQIS